MGMLARYTLTNGVYFNVPPQYDIDTRGEHGIYQWRVLLEEEVIHTSSDGYPSHDSAIEAACQFILDHYQKVLLTGKE